MRSENTMTKQDSELHSELNSEEFELKSKSQLKRDMHALQALGEQLIQLNNSRLVKLSLPENLHEALITAKNIKKHGALKRQTQYIGRLMRNIDAQPIIDYLASLQAKKQQGNEEFKKIEIWRDKLLSQDFQALNDLISQYPHLDIQHIRTLVRNALAQSKQGKTPKASRALFKYLRTSITQPQQAE